MHALGLWGEAVVGRYLLRRGHRLLSHRFRTAQGEIDLIAMSPDRRLRFIEVKTRRSVRFGSPEAAVSRRKLGRIRTAAARYLAELPPEAAGYRSMGIDVITVTVRPGRGVRIREYRDVA